MISVGNVLSRGVTFFSKNFLPLTGISALICLPEALATLWVRPGLEYSLDIPTLIGLCVFVVAGLFKWALPAAFVAAVTADLEDQPISAGDSLKHLWPRLLDSIGLSLLSWLAVASPVAVALALSVFARFLGPLGFLLSLLGMAAALVAMVIISCGLFVAQPALIMEEKSAVEALKRSWWLTTARRGTIFGIALVSTLIGIGIFMIAGILGGFFSLLGANQILAGSAVAFVSQAVFLAFLSVLPGVVYYELKKAKQDLEELGTPWQGD